MNRMCSIIFLLFISFFWGSFCGSNSHEAANSDDLELPFFCKAPKKAEDVIDVLKEYNRSVPSYKADFFLRARYLDDEGKLRNNNLDGNTNVDNVNKRYYLLLTLNNITIFESRNRGRCIEIYVNDPERGADFIIKDDILSMKLENYYQGVNINMIDLIMLLRGTFPFLTNRNDELKIEKLENSDSLIQWKLINEEEKTSQIITWAEKNDELGCKLPSSLVHFENDQREYKIKFSEYDNYDDRSKENEKIKGKFVVQPTYAKMDYYKTSAQLSLKLSDNRETFPRFVGANFDIELPSEIPVKGPGCP
jgi:hypothetical protein